MRHPDLPRSLQLDNRPGLPVDSRLLIEQYPRDIWTGHVNLGQMAQFWLKRHDMFRDLIAAMSEATNELREGRRLPDQFRAWFVPRFNFFMEQLHTHHHIEDSHYFPVFMKAERRLIRGFEMLESDHDMIDGRLNRLLETGIALDKALRVGGDPLKRESEVSANALDGFMTTLKRHLEDEEDLIVPVILDQGERRLGIG